MSPAFPDMDCRGNYLNKIISIILLSSFLISSKGSNLQQCFTINDETDCTSNSDCQWSQFDNPPISCESSNPSDCYCADSGLLSSPCTEFQDIIFLVDASCPMSVEQCKQQQLDIADTMSYIRHLARKKANPTHDNPYATIRIGYIEYGESVNIKINLDDSPENMNMTDAHQSRFMIYETIENSSICNGDTMQRIVSNSTLQAAIGEAMNLFKTQQTNSLVPFHDGKILIFSNCGLSEEDKQNICDEYEDELMSSNKKDDGYNIFMVNNNPDNMTMSNPDEYIMCLVEYDPNRIVTIKQNDDFTANINSIKEQVCDTPTQSPTPDPTPPPTRSPTTAYPTQVPTTSQPTTSKPTTVEPTKVPTTDPTTAEPTTDPTNDPTADPTANPTTAAPTTGNPTSVSPTTVSPSTAQPTTTTLTTVITETTDQSTTSAPITSNQNDQNEDQDDDEIETFPVVTEVLFTSTIEMTNDLGNNNVEAVLSENTMTVMDIIRYSRKLLCICDNLFICKKEQA